ncbi:hypothetical protein [Actinoalloteichus fjordicus]|uniref:hypothetical protein n=1 Tax=Actinoalloteichus fjordicus TaxID=1612552 RepID=UPI000950EB61|nr:hypothetical protein [Actinoalloteichus fjordicus]
MDVEKSPRTGLPDQARAPDAWAGSEGRMPRRVSPAASCRAAEHDPPVAVAVAVAVRDRAVPRLGGIPITATRSSRRASENETGRDRTTTIPPDPQPSRARLRR